MIQIAAVFVNIAKSIGITLAVFASIAQQMIIKVLLFMNIVISGENTMAMVRNTTIGSKIKTTNGRNKKNRMIINTGRTRIKQ
jgi:hypothetical protein